MNDLNLIYMIFEDAQHFAGGILLIIFLFLIGGSKSYINFWLNGYSSKLIGFQIGCV